MDMAAPKPGERGLDVGAGMGPATVLAAKRGAHVVAVDPSGFMRAFCGFRRLLQRARRRITVESGVAEDLPVAGGSTEVLWAVNAVHHWVDHPAVWPEFARVLAPGGRLVLVDEDFDEDDEFFDDEWDDFHVARQKPVLDESTISDIEVLNAQKKKQPAFRRQEWFRYRRLSKTG